MTNVLHREDGPAVECPNGTYQYYIDNKLHRLDGPALFTIGGGKCYYHWIYYDKWLVKRVMSIKTSEEEIKKILIEGQKEYNSLLKLKAFW